MAGLVPAIHAAPPRQTCRYRVGGWTWMAGTSPAMTIWGCKGRRNYNQFSSPGQPCAERREKRPERLCKPASVASGRMTERRRGYMFRRGVYPTGFHHASRQMGQQPRYPHSRRRDPEALKLRAGDESRNPCRRRAPLRARAQARPRRMARPSARLRGRLPADFVFDRDEANER